MADLLELAITLVEKGGAVAGLGGGSVATWLWTRIEKRLKGAKDCADAAHSIADKAATKEELKNLRDELTAFRKDVERALRGSSSGFETKFTERFVGLETRMSALEDDFDEKVKEDQRSWEAMQRAMGRIEGATQRDRDT